MFLFGKKASFASICADIVRDADEAVLLLGTHRDIVFCNRGAVHMLGYTKRELVQENYDALVPERFQKEYKGLIEHQSIPFNTKTLQPLKPRQVFIRCKNGDECIASITVFETDQIPDISYVVVLRDVSHSRQSEEELVKLVTTDSLTHAYNAREFLNIAEREASRANRYNRPLSVMVLDLDQFKKLNEAYGYPAGDKVLQRVSTICQSMMRKVDVFARWQGEKFVALLPETDLEGAGVIAERLRKAVQGNMLSLNAHTIKFTCSIGLTMLRHAESTIDEPMKRAQEAVNISKAEGFNRVRVVP